MRKWKNLVNLNQPSLNWKQFIEAHFWLNREGREADRRKTSKVMKVGLESNYKLKGFVLQIHFILGYFGEF